jgi:hypothetical protein
MFKRLGSRIAQPQADYILAIVRRPPGWRPESLDSIPPDEEVLEEHVVASFAEAHEDRARCNHIALRCNIDKWAVVKQTGSNI